jgi:hypothetical protein
MYVKGKASFFSFLKMMANRDKNVHGKGGKLYRRANYTHSHPLLYLLLLLLSLS